MDRSTLEKRMSSVFTFHRRGAIEVKNVLPGVHVTPYLLDRERGVWVLYVRLEPKTILPRRVHTAPTHFYTTAGSWVADNQPDELHYAGSYIYAEAGSVHSLQTDRGAEGFMVGEGALINVDVGGAPTSMIDAGWIEDQVRGIALRDRQPPPKYLSYAGASLPPGNCP